MAYSKYINDLLDRVDEKVKAKPDKAAEKSKQKLGNAYRSELSHTAPSKTYSFSFSNRSSSARRTSGSNTTSKTSSIRRCS